MRGVFKVGDIITGRPVSNRLYGITNKNAIMIVTHVFNSLNRITVKVLFETEYTNSVGDEYGVSNDNNTFRLLM